MKTQEENEELSVSYDKMLMYEIKIRAQLKFKKKYFPENRKDNYINMIMDVLIFNKNCHLVTMFKDYMILDFIDEFFKRFYRTNESKDRIPRFANFYKNYLKFFCKPTFRNFEINDIIQEHSEKKAEIYYNQNFKNKKDKINFDEGLFEDDDESYKVSKSKIEKTMFNDIIKKQIDETSLGIIQTEENSELTINLQPNDFISNQSFLYTKNSNEESLLNAINALNGKKLIKNKKAYQPKISQHYMNYSVNPNQKNSKLLSYTALCQKKKINSKSKNSNFRDSIKDEKSSHTKSQIQFKVKNIKKSRNQNTQSSNNNLHTLTKLDLKFQTYNNKSNNSKKVGIGLFNTQKVENLLNKFQKNIIHQKNMYSIDNLISKKSKKNFTNSTISNLNHSNKTKKCPTNINNNTSSLRKNNNSTNKKRIGSSYSINKNKKTLKNNKIINKKVQNHHINYTNNNDDIVKITLATLFMNEHKSNSLKNPSHHRTNSNNNNNINNNKQIQNFNININNQINISNNQFQEIISSKLKNQLSKNDKVDLTICNNLKNIIVEKTKKFSRNKGRSIELKINTISTSNNQNSVYRSCSGLDKKMLTITTNNLNLKSPNKSNISNQDKIHKISTSKLIKSLGKYKVMDIYSRSKGIGSNLNFKIINNTISPKNKSEK